MSKSPDKVWTQRLPKGWETNVLHGDHAWIGRAVFSDKGKLAASLMNWYNPPTLHMVMRSRPNPGHYFHRRVILWMPRKCGSLILTVHAASQGDLCV